MTESVQSCFELSIHLSVQRTSRELLIKIVRGKKYREMYRKFKTRLDAFCHSYIRPIFFLKKAMFYQNYLTSDSIQTLLFQACLPTRQNRDKAYSLENEASNRGNHA